MSNTETAGLVTLTAPVVMAYPNLIVAKAIQRDGKDKGEPKFSAQFLFRPDSPDLAAIKAEIKKVALAKWPGRAIGTQSQQGLFKLPIKPGDAAADKRKAAGKEDGEFQRGFVMLRGASKFRPKLGILQAGRLVELDGDGPINAHKDQFYFGVEVFAQFNFVAYEGGNGPDGVTAYLQSVLSTGKGKKLSSGGTSLADTFKGYVGTVTGDNPLGDGSDLDDEIPF
jgi:hypothetical protein